MHSCAVEHFPVQGRCVQRKAQNVEEANRRERVRQELGVIDGMKEDVPMVQPKRVGRRDG